VTRAQHADRSSTNWNAHVRVSQPEVAALNLERERAAWSTPGQMSGCPARSASTRTRTARLDCAVKSTSALGHTSEKIAHHYAGEARKAAAAELMAKHILAS
jgi:hypothetical protein